MANLPALVAAAHTRISGERTSAEWLGQLEKAGVPAGPVLTVQEMHAHPQTKARDMVPMVEHSVVGKVQTLGLPVKFSATPGAVGSGAPTLGQHSRDVLAEAGYSPPEIDDLIKDGVVAGPSRQVE